MALIRIRFRRGTASSWSSANTVLLSGEPGWESDTNKIKIGDGATAWNSLAYLVTGGGGGGTVASTDITDATTTGRAVLTAASQTAARSAIAAGTSNLALGTTSTTALAGNTPYTPNTRTVNGHALTTDVNVLASDLSDLTAQILIQIQALGVFTSVKESGSVYPNRPATTAPVVFIGADTPTSGGSTAGGNNKAVNGLDFWWKTA